jgi:O-antigen ligase
MRPQGWLLLPTAILAIALGIGTAYFSTTDIVVLGIAVVLIIVGVLLSRPLSRVVSLDDQYPDRIEDDGRYRRPRQLLYAGLLTMCWLQLRVHGVTVSDALFLGALIWAFVEWAGMRARDTVTLPPGAWPGIWLFTVGAGASTVVYSTDKLSSFGVIARVFYLIAAWFWLGGISLRTPDHLWTAIKYWVASAAVCGIWALGQKYGHLPGGIESGRVAGLSDGPNDLGALCACALVPGLVLAYRDRRWILAVFGVAIGLILSGSIGAGFAALVAIAFCLTSRDLVRLATISIAISVIVLLLISPLIGHSAITRFSAATTVGSAYNQDTLFIRIDTYKAAWQRIESEPFLGTGLDMESSSIYNDQTRVSYQVHNLFLGRWYDSGILGLIGIFLLVGSIGLAGWRLILKSPDRLLAITIFAAFIAYIGADMSEPSLYKRYSLVPALIIVALRAVAIRSTQTERLPREAADGAKARLNVAQDVPFATSP